MDSTRILIIMVISFSDVVTIYLLTNNLLGYNSARAVFKLKPLPTFFVLLSFFSLYVLGDIFPFTYQATLRPVGTLLLTWLFVEKKKTVLERNELILTWSLIVAIVHSLFIPFILTVHIFTDYDLLVRAWVYFAGATTVGILCYFVDLNKLLILILRRTLFKVLAFIVSLFFFFISSTIITFADILTHDLIFIPFFIAIGIGLIHSFSVIHKNTSILPDNYHDAKKLLMQVEILSKATNDIVEIRQLISKMTELMGLPTPKRKDLAKKTTGQEKFRDFFNQSLCAFLEEKKINAEKVSTKVEVNDLYGSIADIELMYIVVSLLEYALDTLTKKQIFIELASSMGNFFFQIRYEYKFEKDFELLKLLFLSGDVDNQVLLNNFSLAKLRKITNENNGAFSIQRQFDEALKTDYITINLEFREAG